MNPEVLAAGSLLSHWVAGRPLVDVRAPVEFQQGHLPGAVNLPILNDFERDLIGKEFRKAGQEAAIQLGESLVSGEIRQQRIEGWKTFLEAHPEAFITCLRGGLRSQITQRWLAESGMQRPRLGGGYKRARALLSERSAEVMQQNSFVLIGGQTGSGKTRLIRELETNNAIDLEGLARHRGSAFGGYTGGQPSQAQFEILLDVELLRRMNESFILLEDESRMIGQNVVPETLFRRMRASAVIWLESGIEERVDEIFSEYILNDLKTSGEKIFSSFAQSTKSITKKLGGLRSQEILNDIENSRQLWSKKPADLESNRVWIKKLLEWYYDPLYQKSQQARDLKVLFRGNAEDVRAHLRQ